MKLEHPNGSTTVETSRDKADAYLSQGWSEVKASAPKPKPEGK